LDEGSTIFCAENNMHEVEAQPLRHGTDYMPGLQPSVCCAGPNLGLRPRLVCGRAVGPSLFLTARLEAFQ
jgi:hypothetical protein